MPEKVLLIVIDALASAVIRPAMAEGRLPTLQKVVDAGWVRWDSTSIFPSITPAATAALVTGGYPRDTGIAGASFYDRQQDRLEYYGDDIWPIMRKGFGRFFEDLLVKLNRDRLRSSTIFECVEEAGHEAGCLNYIWYRGKHQHEVQVPWLLRLWPTVPFSAQVQGPANLSLGDFVTSFRSRQGWRTGGMFHRFGFNDRSTAEALLSLATWQGLPKLTVAYFPDNDFASHADGPAQALAAVEQADKHLEKVFQFWGGIERMSEEIAVLITGDHAQSDLLHDEQLRSIRLDLLLDDFRVADTGVDWREEEDILICLNMRAAQIYCRPQAWDRREQLASALLSDARMDQVIFEEHPSDLPAAIYTVATSDRGRLQFGLHEHLENIAVDEYGNRWSYRGSLAAVDAKIVDGNRLKYGDYPNALERIYNAFDGQVSGDFWITARVGHEFQLSETSVHRRGSHGSLHALDSQSPLIGVGIEPPERTPRAVDVAELCLGAIGVTSCLPRQHSASHV